MGASLGTVEYAFLKSQQFSLNISAYDGTDNFKHAVALIYELQDEDRKFLLDKTVVHYTETFPERETVEEINDRFAALLPDWVTADKLELAGYEE